MIPKIIHYCWFGRNPLPELAQKCIASWKKYLPDYEIKMDPIRGFVNTHCLCLVMEIESLYSFSPTIGKQAFIVLTYRKSSKSSQQYINQTFLDRKQSYFFLN